MTSAAANRPSERQAALEPPIERIEVASLYEASEELEATLGVLARAVAVTQLAPHASAR
jgi:hypothetical protein